MSCLLTDSDQYLQGTYKAYFAYSVSTAFVERGISKVREVADALPPLPSAVKKPTIALCSSLCTNSIIRVRAGEEFAP